MHAARLKGSSKDVVLKVLKPRVEDTLVTDLNFLYLAGKLLQIISPDLERTSLVGIIEDIRTSMLDEVRPHTCLAPQALRFAGIGSWLCDRHTFQSHWDVVV